MEDVFDGLSALDRDALMSRMAEELAEIRRSLHVEAKTLAQKVGMDADTLRQVETGARSMNWSEFMGILFVLWNDETGRELIEKKSLFPDALKAAMSVNRNAHTRPGTDL